MRSQDDLPDHDAQPSIAAARVGDDELIIAAEARQTLPGDEHVRNRAGGGRPFRQKAFKQVSRVHNERR